MAEELKNQVELHNVKNEEEEKIKESDDESVSIHIDIDKDHFQVEHFISNPFVIILGVESYKWSGLRLLPGVQQDVKMMRELFYQKLKFETKVLKDYAQHYSKDDIIEFLDVECVEKIKKQPDEYKYDALICIISGHGIADYFICGDGEKLSIEKNLFTRFSADFVKTLAAYPKIFIFDICRGQEFPKEIEEEFVNVRGSSMISLNVESGYRISYATTKNKVVPSSPSGGKFIKAFYNTMLHLFQHKILHEIDFQTILRMTSQKATAKRANICPVHEDYTVYKLFLQCQYDDDISVKFENEYRIKSELKKLFDKSCIKSRDEQWKIIEQLLSTKTNDDDDDMEMRRLKTMSSMSLMDYDKMRINSSLVMAQQTKEQRLKKWLDEASLGQYYEKFIDGGYESLDAVKMFITDEKLKRIGVSKEGHRDKLIMLIIELRSKDEEDQKTMNPKKLDLKKFLERDDVGLGQFYEKLIERGFESMDDLRDVKEEAFEIAINTEGHRIKLVKCVKREYQCWRRLCSCDAENQRCSCIIL